MIERSTMSGRFVLVTGATSGIGEATARALAANGATVAIVGRDEQRAVAAQQRIRQAAGTDQVHVLLADLSSQREVRSLAQEVTKRFDRLDALVNNAGVDVGTRILTSDGLELTFAVNYLAPFLLSHLLLDLLKASNPSRIVNVASSAHRGGEIDFDDLQSEQRFGQRAYNNSKLALVLFTFELAQRLKATGVTANCVDPGFVRTSLGATMPLGYRLAGMLMWPIMSAPDKGADVTVRAVTSPELVDVTGSYFKRGRRIETGPKTHDPAVAERLWQVSEKLVAATEAG